MLTRAHLYDGDSAIRYDALVAVDDGRLHIRWGEESAWIDPALLTMSSGDEKPLRLGRSDRPGWRLTLDDPVDPALAALLPRPHRYGRWVDRIGLGKAAVAFAAVAALVVGAGYAAPGAVAPYVPLSWEKNLGAAMVGDFGDYSCKTAPATAAFAHLQQRLEPGRGDRLDMRVLDIPIFNAAALPGGYIVYFNGAFDESKNPDAIAGIIAHEIAHVRRRHVTESLIRELGIGALIRLFAGGVGANASQLVGLSYTRAAETEADADAIAMLRAAGIDPRPTADLFAQLDKQHGGSDDDGFTRFTASHPVTRERAAAFRNSHDAKAAYRPALDAASLQALTQACASLGRAGPRKWDWLIERAPRQPRREKPHAASQPSPSDSSTATSP